MAQGGFRFIKIISHKLQKVNSIYIHKFNVFRKTFVLWARVCQLKSIPKVKKPAKCRKKGALQGARGVVQ